MRLWQSVGLEVCVIGGSDFGPLGEMGAMELHKIFDWAARSPRGPSIRQLCMRGGGVWRRADDAYVWVGVQG